MKIPKTLQRPFRSATSQKLYHFSEDPNITLFKPRPGRQLEGRPEGEKLVWVIDEHHSPVYYFPRECPRIVLWPIEGSTQADIDLWMGSGDARMIAHIESAWIKRFDRCQLYRYSFDATGFESLHDYGGYVSQNTVAPLEITPVGELREALDEANIKLRIVESFLPLAEAWNSTLLFSGIRLRNVQNWVAPSNVKPR